VVSGLEDLIEDRLADLLNQEWCPQAFRLYSSGGRAAASEQNCPNKYRVRLTHYRSIEPSDWYSYESATNQWTTIPDFTVSLQLW
jgi:hypothetical protein